MHNVLVLHGTVYILVLHGQVYILVLHLQVYTLVLHGNVYILVLHGNVYTLVLHGEVYILVLHAHGTRANTKQVLEAACHTNHRLRVATYSESYITEYTSIRR